MTDRIMCRKVVTTVNKVLLIFHQADAQVHLPHRRGEGTGHGTVSQSGARTGVRVCRSGSSGVTAQQTQKRRRRDAGEG